MEESKTLELAISNAELALRILARKARSAYEEWGNIDEDDLPGRIRTRLMPEGMEWPPRDMDDRPLEIGQSAHFTLDAIDHESLGTVPGGKECDGVITAFRYQGEGGATWVVMGENDDEYFEAWSCDVSANPLDADGVPILMGDRVYTVNAGRSQGPGHHVTGFGTDDGEHVLVYLDCGEHMVPHLLSHRAPEPPATLSADCRDTVAPDSWERWREDAALVACDYCDRRGIGYDHDSDAEARQAEDLERRAKALTKEVG